MGRFQEAIGHLIDAAYGRGMDGEKISRRLIEGGLKMMIDDNEIDRSHRIRINDDNDGSFHITTMRLGDEDVIEEAPTMHKVAAIMGREPRNGERITITIDRDGKGFTTERVVGDDDMPAPYPAMSCSRLHELLDYASCYGDYDENTPNGTPSTSDGEGGHGMNDYRRAAIVLLKKALGFLPPDTNDTIVFPDHGYRVAQLEAVATESMQMFDGYAQLHLAKMPPDLDKADRNSRMAAKLSAALGVAYTAPDGPENNPEKGQERDSIVLASERPRKLSLAPLDRAELLAWFDMKLDGCAKNGMAEAYSVIRAFRDEVAQHLEAAPIDFAVTLRAFYQDVHDRNVKAGWWSDLASGQPKKRSVGELFILLVTEMAEAYDAYLTGEPDNKLPQYPGLGVELGDLQIRLADFCGALAAGKIVADSGVQNPGDEAFRRIAEIAEKYEAIRKTEAAHGEPETGEEIGAQDVAVMIVDKLAFNAQRPDHKIENRLKEDGKRT